MGYDECGQRERQNRRQSAMRRDVIADRWKNADCPLRGAVQADAREPVVNDWSPEPLHHITRERRGVLATRGDLPQNLVMDVALHRGAAHRMLYRISNRPAAPPHAPRRE